MNGIDLTIPFGKFKGKRVKDLPDSYLSWLCDQDWLREPLLSAVTEEYDRRCHERANDRCYQPRLLPVAVSQVAESIVSVGYRQLSRKLHPDVGGSHEEMLALNAAADWLRRVVGQSNG